tara:strand:+ start:353 stop:1852 length:1500 start_codon:yes stop_codon:yes gene_type:complete
MGLSSFLLKWLAKKEYKKYSLNKQCAIKNQTDIFNKIMLRGRGSEFWKQKKIPNIKKYNQFQSLLPISDYESIRPFISQISNGEKNILTKGMPLYFAITSGTTSGTKYIPLTKEMLAFQTQAIKELLLLYSYQTNNYNISPNVGMMFVQGSPNLQYLNKVPFAKLSGITARHIPFFLKKNRYPSMKTNCIENWAEKIDAIVQETYNKDMQIIGGIPPWVMTYFEALLSFKNKKSLQEIFPNLMLYIHGGSGFGPYKKAFFNMCGTIDTLEVYPASEGFFAYQDDLNDPSMLLLTNHGVFYEFVELADFQAQKMNRIPLEDVQLNIDYVMIVSTIAGLWVYNTGDTIRFTSRSPYKILFSGRSAQYCSAFGEHVIEKEVQAALEGAIKKHGGIVSEFTVAPKIMTESHLSHHQWFIEFKCIPDDLSFFERTLNTIMEKQNLYYRDLVKSKVIVPLKLFVVKVGGFNAYMKSIGKFGGQNKCPHLSNETKIANFLLKNYVK